MLIITVLSNPNLLLYEKDISRLILTVSVPFSLIFCIMLPSSSWTLLQLKNEKNNILTLTAKKNPNTGLSSFRHIPGNIYCKPV